MAVQAQFQFQYPTPYSQNNTLLDEFQLQFIDCASNHQSDLTNYNPSISNKRAREDDSANSSSCRIDSDPFLSHFLNHSLEIDALIRAQNQKLKSGLEQIQTKQYRNIMSAMELRFIQMLQNKEVEYESVAMKNQELEEKVRQISAENQIWYNVMKNNEVIAASLKSTLDKVLLQNSVKFDDVGVNEGYGDSDGTALIADGATSCSNEVEKRNDGAVRNVTERRLCRICMGTDVSVLVLPCRHLCLCKVCEFVCDTCPVCGVGKKASLQVFIS